MFAGAVPAERSPCSPLHFRCLWMALTRAVSVRTVSFPCFPLQAAEVMDKAARIILPLVLRGMGLRADALSGVLDDVHRPSTVVSSSELHVARYCGPVDGEDMLSGSVACHTCQPLHDKAML